MRAFVAIDLPSAAPIPARERARSPSDHLTLRFFADLPVESVSAVIDALSEAARESTPFLITIDGIGAFPSPRDPKVVWRGITDGRDALIDLVAGLDRRLSRIGLPSEARPFVPHLTWFRVRSDAERAFAREVLAGGTGPGPLSVPVRTIALKESTLTRDGPIHRTIASVELGSHSELA
jgi:2'-5' RNA ligase